MITMRQILLSILATLAMAAVAQTNPRLDENHLLLDGSLTDEEVLSMPFTYNDFRQAVSHFKDTTTLYIRPWVYWVDNPDVPEVVRGEDGREPFGIVIHAKKLTLTGLAECPEDVVLASQRGQTQGAVGNFTMLDMHVDELHVENMTLGNYCNVDLDYRLNPSLSRRKRSDAITQAHVGYVHGRKLTARRVRFISRLNLNPLNGAQESLYDSCHFECTDDALNGGNAIYRHCDFDLYGAKPLWSTFGAGPLFYDCDFRVRSNNRETFFCKQCGQVTVINCRYHAPENSYLGWAPYPQRWLRCYQKDFTLNGQPYIIGSRQQENTIVMDSTDIYTNQQPSLSINQHEAEMIENGEPLALSVNGEGRMVVWRIEQPYDQIACIDRVTGDSVTVSIDCDDIVEPVTFPVTAYAVGDTSNPALAVCMVTVRPVPLSSPTFIERPGIRIKDGTAFLDYRLNLEGFSDQSQIVWSRIDDENGGPEIILACSNDGPQRQYKLRPGDIGHRIAATICPAHTRSTEGPATAATSRSIRKNDVKGEFCMETDFSDLWCGWSEVLAPDTWTADGYKPADTSEYDWSFDREKPMWKYGEGFNGAVGKGLLQAQRGARLRFTPASRTYNNMSLTLQVDPTKTAGQGFGSATGQYMDVCLKFDTQTLTGYGLRIIRTVKHAKAVDFLLVEYRNGTVMPLTEAVSSTCYRTGCTIALDYSDGLLSAHVETQTPRPDDSDLPHQVDLQAQVDANPYGGIHIQHTGSCGESTTMLHRLKAVWQQ
ncbi:MAG: hypothetical protein IJT98_04735 [Prevotella sp.]|nr:hypothetical protein [Prevotella sp.]